MKTILPAAALIYTLSNGLALHSEAQQAAAGAGQTPLSATPENTDEIVVTAQRRKENIQTVPVAVTSLSSVQLENFGVKDFEDYAKSIPNVSFQFGGSGDGNAGQGVSQSRTVTIRGISGENTTSVYIDDTPLPMSIDPQILDLDRVEVLRGPQGTLFGAASMGGTIRLITRQPNTQEFYGNVDGQVFGVNHAGAGGAGYSASGTVNIPIVTDTLALRFSAFDSYQPGFFSRTTNDPLAYSLSGVPAPGPVQTQKNIGAQRNEGLVASALYAPESLDGLEIKPMVIWQKTRANGLPLADYTPSNLVQRRIIGPDEAYSDEWLFTSLAMSYKTDYGRFVSSTSGFWREPFDLEEGSDGQSAFLYQAGLIPTPTVVPSLSYSTFYQKSFTQEVRFESSLDGPVQFITGLFYNYSNDNARYYVITPGQNALSGGVIGTDITLAQSQPFVSRQIAGFASVDYNITDSIQASFGLRKAYLRNTQVVVQSGLFGNGPNNNTAGYGAAGHSDKALTPHFSIKYQITPDIMVYNTESEGFRPGGANVALGSICNSSLAAAGLPQGTIAYNADSLWNYEIGAKTSWFEKQLTVDGAVYHIDWNKIQETVRFNCGFSDILNAGAATSDGSELEITYRPIKGVTLTSATGYEQASITKSSITDPPARVGQPLNGVPKWTESVTAEYNFPTAWGDGFVRGQYNFVGRSLSLANDQVNGRVRKAYQLVDIRTGLSHGPWTLALFIKNLFDSRANLGDEEAETLEAPGRPRWIVAVPRTVGLDARYEF